MKLPDSLCEDLKELRDLVEREFSDPKARWIHYSKKMAQHMKGAESSEKASEGLPKRPKSKLMRRSELHRKAADIALKLSQWVPLKDS